MQGPVTIVVNEGAHGGDRRVHGQLHEILSRTPEPPVRIVFTSPGTGVRELSRRALADGAAAVVAAGGDGTVSGVASVLAGTDAALGILPLGTLNHFARALRLPRAIDEALEIALHGHEVRVDVGEVNGHAFVNNSSIGLYPSFVAARRLARRTGHVRKLAGLRGALAVVRRLPKIPVHVTAGGLDVAREVPFVFVGNNRYVVEGARRAGHRDALDEGTLSLVVPREASSADVARLALRALSGKLRRGVDVDETLAREIRVASPLAELSVAVDGEITTLRPPLVYVVRPRALRVRVARSIVERAA
jgi:diacylglycerol kinase family enzyme